MIIIWLINRLYAFQSDFVQRVTSSRFSGKTADDKDLSEMSECERRSDARLKTTDGRTAYNDRYNNISSNE